MTRSSNSGTPSTISPPSGIGPLFRTRFDGPDELMLFVTGRLSKSSREAMLVRLRRVANEFADLHSDDPRRLFDECTAMHMLVAIRPWELSKFAEMQRRK